MAGCAVYGYIWEDGVAFEFGAGRFWGGGGSVDVVKLGVGIVVGVVDVDTVWLTWRDDGGCGESRKGGEEED